MASEPVSTTGPPTTPGGGGSVPSRKEIRDFQDNFPDQWNLYILALRALQQADETSLTSWYEIAGIHGRPYRPWGGVPGIAGQRSGYCTHSSILFLIWHRPYLALFEQALYEHVQTIAGLFTPELRDRYQQAANGWRMPYWDWAAMETPGFPTAISNQQVQVTETDGQVHDIPNPLHHYTFNPLNPVPGDFGPAPFGRWPTTLRYPTNSSPGATSQNTRVASNMNSQSRNLRDNVYFVMTSLTDFGSFSNDLFSPGAPLGAGSLEDVHDNVHGYTGGNGHMGQIPYSAFDPVFWLHHANIDRLFAMWQVLNPDSAVPSESTQFGTFTTAPGSVETADSPLTPFYQDTPGNYWTSDTARETYTFGYTYPEVQPWNFTTPDLLQQSVRAAIQSLYGSVPMRVGAPMPRAVPADANPKQAALGSGNPGISDDGPAVGATAAPAGQTKNTESGELRHIPREGKYREWIANIKVQKHCLGQSFQVHVFIGDVPADPESWITHDRNIGTFNVLADDPYSTGCEKCKTDAASDLVITGIVPLTSTLLDKIKDGELQDLEPAHVVPYLKERLHWRVTLSDGTEHPRENVNDLKVIILSTEVSVPTDENAFPTYSGEYQLHHQITEGRPGGYNDGDVY